MAYILAIDQGTSSTRAIIYDLNGQSICQAQYLITQFYPQVGYVEHDPEEIWKKTLKAIKSVVAQINVKQIIACGITNQRETTLIWDKETGGTLAPAIVWQDRRTEDFCSSLSKHNGMIHEKTGLFSDAYFSATKLNWLLNHVPLARTYAKQNRLAFGTIDSFLLWRLTGGTVHATDITNASRTLLFNIHTKQWDKELLALFDIPESILPSVFASDHYFGEIEKELVSASIPIYSVIGDQQAALIGQGCIAPGMIKATYGTGGFLMLNTGKTPIASKHKLLTTIAYQIQGETCYALEGALYQAGTTIQWLRDELQMIKTASETEALANSLESNDGVYLVPSFSGLGAPHWLSTHGACIIGLARNTGPAHFARAALESVCYQTLDILKCMREDSSIPISLLRVDGGMTVNQWFLQFLASLCNVIVQRPRSVETTALGAAMLAAVGCGALTNLIAAANLCFCEKEYQAQSDLSRMDEYYQKWLKAIKTVTE